jgi:hypothetical protein
MDSISPASSLNRFASGQPQYRPIVLQGRHDRFARTTPNGRGRTLQGKREVVCEIRYQAARASPGGSYRALSCRLDLMLGQYNHMKRADIIRAIGSQHIEEAIKFVDQHGVPSELAFFRSRSIGLAHSSSGHPPVPPVKRRFIRES